MRITFPHMGNLYMIAKPLFEDLGFEVIVAPLNNKNTLDIGKRYAPEFICMPLKLNIGNFIQAIEMGADTIVMLGGCGPCRFGYYGVLEKEILSHAGYEVNMITIEPLFYGFKNFIEQAGKIFGQKNLLHVLFKSFKLAKMIDNLEKRIHYLRPREKVKGSVDKIYTHFKNEAFNVKGIDEMMLLIEKTNILFDNLHIVDEDIKKVAIVGEIYTIIDDYANLNIEKTLGEFGFEVERNLYVSSWIETHLIKPLFKMEDIITKNYSKGVMERLIGGHARESISYAKWYAAKNYCGIIHILPLTCMPEIIAKSILQNIKDKINIPIMSIVIDEVESDVGIKTRLEAFLDLINSRGDEFEKNGMLSWD